MNLISGARQSTRTRGRRFEDEAERFLISNGYEILERNWQAGHKEIDLIARKGRTIIFVEVKAGGSKSFGHPAARVGRRKQINVIQAAEQYISEKEIKDFDFRFDLITFHQGKLEHYSAAFMREDN